MGRGFRRLETSDGYGFGFSHSTPCGGMTEARISLGAEIVNAKMQINPENSMQPAGLAKLGRHPDPSAKVRRQHLES
jgi:hypothetical protein